MRIAAQCILKHSFVFWSDLWVVTTASQFSSILSKPYISLSFVIVCKVLYSDCSPFEGVPTMLRQDFLAADIILGMNLQYIYCDGLLCLNILKFFCYFLTFGSFLQILAADFINHNILVVSGVLLSRIAGFVYQKLSPSYYLLPGRLFKGLLIRKPMLRVEN